ncbi:MAG TPA: hypothetical protein VGK54_18490, partial [Chloroflexota bacterium]
LVGQAEALLGNRASALEHYQRSLDWTTKIRFRPEVALTRLAMAELLLDRALTTNPTPTETEEGLAHLDFATKEFEAMKMAPALARATNLRATLASL